MFTPTLTNDFTFGWARPSLKRLDQGTMDILPQRETPRNRYFKNLGDPSIIGFRTHSIEVEGYGRLGIGGTSIFDNPGLPFGSNASWVKGSHSTKVGCNYVNKGERALGARGRNVSFNKQFTRSGGVDRSVGADGMPSWMLALPSSMRNPFSCGGEEPRRTAWNDVWVFYFEDKW